MRVQERMDLMQCRTAQDVRDLAKTMARKRRECLKPQPAQIAAPKLKTLESTQDLNSQSSETTQTPAMKPFSVLSTIMRLVLTEVSEAHNMPPEYLLRKDTRRWWVTRPRQEAIFIMSLATACSTIKLGRMFGGFDHSTVWHAIDRVKHECEFDMELNERINRVCDQIAKLKAEAVA